MVYGLKINQTVSPEDIGFMAAQGTPPGVPQRNNHGTNILLGLIQLGFPLDKALRIASQAQGPDENAPQFWDMTIPTEDNTGTLDPILITGDRSGDLGGVP
ncbi:MAG: hypothetical protein CL608_34195 [Anaerolineaceae bacterium]|jgi:hypothetical protein|nr:hypothetical protein [Anaerolineaceae bacterium]